MGFLIIHTPRTGSKKAATIVGPGQMRNRGAIKRLVQEAQKQAIVARASLDAQKQAEGFQALPLRLEKAIGIAVPMPNYPGRGYEIFLLAGIDTSKIDAAATRELQTRLVTQTMGLAEPLISTQIPWAQRNDPVNHAQFSGDFVIRDELGSYALMFTKLPDASIEAGGLAMHEDFKPFRWKFIAFLMLTGAGLYALQNYLPPALKGVSKAVSIIPGLLWPFLYTSRYYAPFIIRFIGYPGALTAAFMMGYFYYNLLSTSVLPVAVANAVFATAVTAITIWIQGKILGTSLESGVSVFVKYGGAILINFIGLSIAWLAPTATKGLYVGFSAAIQGGMESPQVAGLPEPKQAAEIDLTTAPTVVARNDIKLKGKPEVEIGAVCFIRVPGTDKVYGLTSRRIIDSRNSDLFGSCSLENLFSELEYWRVRLFRNKAAYVEFEGIAGKPEDYAGSEVLFLKLKPGAEPPSLITELSPSAPGAKDSALVIATSFESGTAINQRLESALLLGYPKKGDQMLLAFMEARDVSNFEGSPILSGSTAIEGIVLGGSPVTQRPFDHESEIVEAASVQQIWKTLCKVEGITIEPPPPPKETPEAASTPAAIQTPVASVPTPTPTRAPAPPKPVVMPDPFATADLDKLDKEMKNLKKLRTQLVKAPPAGKTLSEQLKRETEITRFNRRRNQIVAAYNRHKVQAGQEVILEVIPLNSAPPDLSDAQKIQEYRAELDKIRADLQEKRKTIDPANLEQVESFYDETAWFNAKSEVLRQAITGSSAPAPSAPAPTNGGAAPAVTPLPLPPPP